MANNYQRRKQAEQAKKPNKFNIILIIVCFVIFAGYQWLNQSKTEAGTAPATQVLATSDSKPNQEAEPNKE